MQRPKHYLRSSILLSTMKNLSEKCEKNGKISKLSCGFRFQLFSHFVLILRHLDVDPRRDLWVHFYSVASNNQVLVT